MERIRSLIDQLHQQKQQNATAAELLFTVQLLHSELINAQQKSTVAPASKIAVTLPSNWTAPASKNIHAPESEVVKEPMVRVPEPVKPEPKPVLQEENEYAAYEPVIPVIEKRVVSKEQPAYMGPGQYVPNTFDTVIETPTLVQYESCKEVNELVANRQESLNDRLKQDKTEVVHVLKQTPVKDLRKAIGVNDRFTFLSELFRGDEPMYERSIKTINNFQVFSEAEYWITRELKYKLGWDDNQHTVQQFYQLVRRRFA